MSSTLKKKGGSAASNSVTSLANSASIKSTNNVGGSKAKCTKAKCGGSIASNSVMRLVSAKSGGKCAGKKCGGSAASTSVTSLVNNAGFASIKSTNMTNAGKCGGKSKSGGFVANTAIKSLPAPAYNYGKGGNISIRNLSELKNSDKFGNSFRIHSKKGGDAPFTIGLDYSIIPKLSYQYGPTVDRTVPYVAMNSMAQGNQNVPLPIHKTVDFNHGSISSSANGSSMNFMYGNQAPIVKGGKKSKSKK